MSHIVNSALYPTKDKFISAINRNDRAVYLNDTGIHHGSMSGPAADVVEFFDCMVTVCNHPHRTWNADLKMVDGKVVVL